MDPVKLIVSANLHRRHQSASQRAMSAARLANIASSGRPGKIASIEAISQSAAAGMLNVGRATVQRAAAILADSILAPAVDSGQVSVTDAYALTRIMREGAVEGETQEPPCGTNVIYTTF